MSTAFQPSAFQNNAFQIDSQTDTHDGGVPDYIKKRLKYNPLTQTYLLYDKIVQEQPAKAAKLKRIIKSYVLEPEQAAKDEIPPRDKVRFDYLQLNDLAYRIYIDELEQLRHEIAVIEQLRLGRRLRQEEEIIMLLIVSCALQE